MKKVILGISFLMMMAFAGTANAQSQKDNCPDKTKCAKEKCEAGKDCEKGLECKLPSRDGRKQCMKGECPFEGLNLSEEQQVKVKDLDKALKASRKEMAEAAKTSGTRVTPEERRKNDVALRTKYLSDLKNILSPEQYTEFLQNFYVNQSQNPASMISRDRMGKKLEKIQKAKIEKINKEKENQN